MQGVRCLLSRFIYITLRVRLHNHHLDLKCIMFQMDWSTYRVISLNKYSARLNLFTIAISIVSYQHIWITSIFYVGRDKCHQLTEDDWLMCTSVKFPLLVQIMVCAFLTSCRFLNQYRCTIQLPHRKWLHFNLNNDEFSFKKMNLQMTFAKCRWFCLDFNMLTDMVSFDGR